MKALAIVAGPRKQQVTDSLTDEVIKGLKERNIYTEKVYLYDLDIKPCLGCYKCKKNKICFIEDDHSEILNKMADSDIIVFASPTYISNVTSEAKKFFDRSLSFFQKTKFGPRRYADKPSRVILITACGAPFPFSHLMGISTGTVRAMKSFFKYMPVKIKTVTATGTKDFNKGSCKNPLAKAYKLGLTV